MRHRLAPRCALTTTATSLNSGGWLMPFMRTGHQFLPRSSQVLAPWACQQKVDQPEPQARNQSAWLHHGCRTGCSSRAAARCQLLRKSPKQKFLKSKKKPWPRCSGRKKLDSTESRSAHTCATCILRSCRSEERRVGNVCFVCRE